MADRRVAVYDSFLREQVVAGDVVDVAGGGCLHELKRWIVEAGEKLASRPDFLLDKGGRLSSNGASETAEDHDRNDEKRYRKRSRRNESQYLQ